MICPACGRPMFEVNGCLPRPGALTRLDEWDWLVLQDPDWLELDLLERCPQCEAARDGYHHHGCPLEQCVLHNQDRIYCDEETHG